MITVELDAKKEKALINHEDIKNGTAFFGVSTNYRKGERFLFIKIKDEYYRLSGDIGSDNIFNVHFGFSKAFTDYEPVDLKIRVVPK